MKQRNVRQGLFFLIIAVLLLGRAFDVFVITSSLIKIVLSALLISFSLASFPKGKFIEGIMPLAFVYVLNEREILNVYPNLNEVNSWLLIWGSLFLGIALESLFKKKKQPVKFYSSFQKFDTQESSTMENSDFVNADFSENHGSKNTKERFSEEINEDFVRIESNFGDRTRYIRVDNYTDGLVDVNFGSLRVYLDQSTFNADGSHLKVDCNFAKVTLYIPSHVKVINNVSSTLGSVNEGIQNPNATNKLILDGDVVFGNLKIVYI